MILNHRTYHYNAIKPTIGPIVYWMQRDQRVNDNHALLYAQELAIELKQPLKVVFCVTSKFINATKAHYSFMLEGLKEIALSLHQKQIEFILLSGKPADEILSFVEKEKCGALITDFNPLLSVRLWKKSIVEKIKISFSEVDAHNIVPCRIASSKQEFGAYTLRPKITKLLPEFLVEFAKLKKHPYASTINGNAEFDVCLKKIKAANSIQKINFIPGEKAALKQLKAFLQYRFNRYEKDRNDPNLDACSGLSPYFHFGHISAQRIALETLKCKGNKESEIAFLEELIVRRELSDNFCFYNDNYDSFEGLPAWAKKTLNEHREDKRDYIYQLEDFENAQTHDDLWNAAQREMMVKGKMHGYMRMYWAKKILEWTENPELAFAIAAYLNDTYSLDGRDPNGYAGIAWAIGGLHDRAWAERPVFGKIRFMNYNGCKKKFDVGKYVDENIKI